jgi:hypothetical protein
MRRAAQIIFAVSCGAVPAAAMPAAAATDASVHRQAVEGNMLLLDIRLEQHVLSDSLTAYQFGQRVFLPLGELAQMLTIAIRSHPADGTASGFVRGEERSFSLNIAQRTVSIGDQTTSFDADLVRVRGNDIYVDSKLLAAWLLVDFDISLSNLSVLLRPRQPLPLQLRLNRELLSGSLGADGAQQQPDFPLVPIRYALAGMPFVDQTVTVGASRVNGESNRHAGVTTFMKGDLAGLQASAFISATNEANSRQARFTVGRADPHGALLGPLKATSFAVGSVAVPGITNVAGTSDTGNGFAFGNVPLDRPTNFNSHTLQGDLPPGWDVELYFNDALIAYQQARADGKYVFADQPLVYGPNEFRLVFHGPQGQLRVERQNFLIDESINVPGSFFYNLGSHRDLDGKHQSSLHAEWGLGGGLTASLDTIGRQSAFGTTRYDSAGLRGFVGAMVFTTNYTRRSGGGSLAELGIKTRFAGMAIDAEHFLLRDFHSDIIPQSPDPIRSRDRLRIDGLLPLAFMRAMPVTLEVQRELLRSGSSTVGANALVSRSVGAMSFSHLLHVSSRPGAREVDGALQVATNVGELRLRGQVNYDIRPGARVSAVALSSDSTLAANYLLNLSATRNFATGEARLNASLNKSLGSYALALNIGIGRHGEALAGIQLFSSFGREPRKSQWIFDAQPMTGSGAVSARVFVDRNGNGVMDAGELPVAGAGFVVNGSQFGARTGADGIAYLDHLPAYRDVNLSVNTATLEDPQLSTLHKGVRLVPRQGNVAQLDFPLALTGEIDGTVFVKANGAKRGIGNVLLELVSRADDVEKVAAQVRSSADGYFIVQDVLPGSYQLRVAAQQLEELRLADPGTRTIRVSDTGAQVNGQNFTLEPR